MKKRFLLALACVMVLAMSAVAFAASSPSASSTGITATTAPATAAAAATAAGATTTTASGTTLAVTTVTPAVAQQMYAQTKSLSALAYVLSTAEYQGTIASGGENVSLACVNVKATDTVDTIVVLHMSATKGMEILKPAAVSAGKVTVFLTDLSPITIAHVPAGTTVNYTSTAAASTSASTSTAATSPKTGEE